MPLATHLPLRRIAYAALALLLLAAVVAAHGPWWAVAAGLVGPDLALLAGAARGLAPGQIHPRGVHAYNAVHRFWIPAGLLVLGGPWTVLGLAWLAHVAVDRAAGYGLRDEHGFQRAG